MSLSREDVCLLFPVGTLVLVDAGDHDMWLDEDTVISEPYKAHEDASGNVYYKVQCSKYGGQIADHLMLPNSVIVQRLRAAQGELP